MALGSKIDAAAETNADLVDVDGRGVSELARNSGCLARDVCRLVDEALHVRVAPRNAAAEIDVFSSTNGL